MGQIFYWILNMAIVGSLAGAVLLLIRNIKRLPRNFIYILYSILLIRFTIPFGFINGFSFLNLLPKGSYRQVNLMTGDIGSEGRLMFSNVIQSAQSYKPLQQKNAGWTLAYEIGSKIWVVIGAILILSYLIMYIRAKRELQQTASINDAICHSEAVRSPITIGIVKPVIILPVGFTKSNPNYPYVIAHERTHIRKHDNLWRMLAVILACVYWFNPMIWVLQKYFLTDMELACDESTIRSFSLIDRKNYAMALLTMSKDRSLAYASSFTDGGVKGRIKWIISYKQITLLSGICLLGFFILCAICLLSN